MFKTLLNNISNLKQDLSRVYYMIKNNINNIRNNKQTNIIIE